MKQIAQGLAALGRGEDKMLVHMTPREVSGLQQLALAHGGSLTIHPQTGLPEAGFLSNILPTLVGVGLSAMGVPPVFAGLGMGAFETARTGNLGKGVMAGLGAYGGAGVGEALQGMGGQAALSAAQSNIDPAMLESMSRAQVMGTVPQQTPAQLMQAGAQSAVNNPSQFASALGQQFNTGLSKAAAGIGGLGALGAFEQKPLSFATPPTQTSNARLSGPVRRPYDQNAPQGYYFTDRGILQPAYAAGGGVGGDGIAALAKGGQYLDGPGDGMSDSIPATIGDKQPARLADGEFVVPADVVSHLGNGSSKAGAKQLYAMMDKVRHARTGTKKQGKQIKAEKYLPA